MSWFDESKELPLHSTSSWLRVIGYEFDAQLFQQSTLFDFTSLFNWKEKTIHSLLSHLFAVGGEPITNFSHFSKVREKKKHNSQVMNE